MLSRAKSIYGKILFTIMLCFVLPLSIVFLFGYSRLEAVMMDKIGELTQSNIRQMEEGLGELSDRVNQTTVYLSSDLRFNELMRQYDNSIPSGTEYQYHTGQPEYMGQYEYLNLAVEMQNIMINYADNWLGDSIEMGIAGNDGHLFATWPEGNTDYTQLAGILEKAREEQATYFTPIHSGFIRFGEHSDYYTYVKVIYDIQEIDKELGILIVTVPLSAVDQIVAKYLNWEEHSTYILNEGNEVVNTSSESGVRSEFADIIKTIPADAKETEQIIQDENGASYLLRTIPVDGMQWKICCIIPYEEVFRDALLLRKYVIGICATLIILLSVITLTVIYRLFAPLRVLRDSMRLAEAGDWEVKPMSSVSQDEIGLLTLGFNRLMKELKNLLEREKESERQKGELKFEMLLAQINPHFLFNTLNSIKWMAVMIHADNITDTIRSLARLLEISMNRQEDILPIREELKNLDSYLEIQGVRYGDLFCVEYKLEDGIREFQTLKLVFQPIVENAIVHNIQEVNPLNIQIEGRTEDKCIVFIIRDNGRGMDREQVQKLLENSDNSKKSIFRGIGVNNVHQRIRLKYGDQYGIQIESEKGRGTIAKIRFPAITFEAAEETLC